MGSEGKRKSLVRPIFPLSEQLRHSSGPHPDQTDILGETRFVPMDVIESVNKFTVEIDVPGVTAADIRVQVQEDFLLVEGVKREALDTHEKVDFLCMERSFGPFKRVVKIPAAVDQNAVRATYRRGVLEIILPKLMDRRHTIRHIPILEEER